MGQSHRRMALAPQNLGGSPLRPERNRKALYRRLPKIFGQPFSIKSANTYCYNATVRSACMYSGNKRLAAGLRRTSHGHRGRRRRSDPMLMTITGLEAKRWGFPQPGTRAPSTPPPLRQVKSLVSDAYRSANSLFFRRLAYFLSKFLYARPVTEPSPIAWPRRGNDAARDGGVGGDHTGGGLRLRTTKQSSPQRGGSEQGG